MILAPNRDAIAYVSRPTGEPGTVRVMAADGSHNRPLFAPPIKGCKDIAYISWNPKNVAQMVVVCRKAEMPYKMLVVSIKRESDGGTAGRAEESE